MGELHSRHHIVELDVRPHLRKKLEPFQIIMEQVKELQPDDIFVLHATFKPTPLLALMKTKGFANKTEKLAKDHWVTTFVRKSNKQLLKEMTGFDPAEAPEQSAQAAPAQETEKRERKKTELDNRGLQPPQPMVRTLSALERSQPGDVVMIHNDRVPVFLIEELNRLGYPFTVDEQPDGSAKVTIQKT